MRPIAFVAAVMALAAALPGRALAAPIALATNLPGAVSYAAPPAGFDALHASAAALETFGFPPRPARSVDNRALHSWERVVGASRERIQPILRQTRFAAGPPSHRSAVSGGSANSYNWSGAVVQNSAQGYGTGAFVSAVGIFNVPVASQATNTCTGGWDHLFSWVGIDGWSSDQVFQAGTESDARCVNGIRSQSYNAWYEWYPSLAVAITNLPVSPGDVMGVWVCATSSTTGRALVTNATTGQYVNIGFSAPAGTTLRGDSVEWIQERPYWNGVRSTLTNFVQAWMSDAGALELNVNILQAPGAYSAGHYGFLVTMLDDRSLPIANATALGPYAIDVKTTGSAR